MRANLFHSVIIILLYNLKITTSGNVFVKSGFGEFKLCLLRNGLGRSDIVERDNLEEYNRLNSQRLRTPPFPNPLAFILVRNERHVLTLVSCGRKWGIHLVPKGGGHSEKKYSFGDSNSVVVDLRNLNMLKINKKSAWVGGGWLIGPLTFALWTQAKVFIPFTECPTVGVSGLATGGGWGFFARQFGMISDSILEAKIVSANATLIRANKKINPDLFWALRGGVASNFGILTQLKFRTFPPPPALFYGELTYDITQFSTVFDSWQKFASTAPNSITGALIVRVGKTSTSFLDTTGNGDNFEILASKFPQTPSKSSSFFTYPHYALFNFRDLSGEVMKPGTLLNSFPDVGNLNRNSPKALYQKRKSFYVSKIIGSDQLRMLGSFVEGMPSSTNLFLESYGGAINNLPNNGTAFIHRHGILYDVIVQYKSYDKNDTAEAIGTIWVERFFEFCKGIFGHSESYQNYVDGDLEDYLGRYFGSNLPGLVQIKRKYDPDNYWRNPQSIPTRLN